jgi:hypothetical protein
MMHTATVTRIFMDPEADSDDAEYTIGGTHDRSCSVWYPCKAEGCQADDEGEFHGVEHLLVGGGGEEFCVESNECGLDYSGEYESIEWQMKSTGIYDIKVDWDGDHWLADLFNRRDRQSADAGQSA